MALKKTAPKQSAGLHQWIAKGGSPKKYKGAIPVNPRGIARGKSGKK